MAQILGRGADADPVLEIHPATGKVVKGAFGGADYVEIQKPSATLKSLADIAVDPMSGQMYGLAWDGNGRYELATVNTATGAVELAGGKLGGKVDTIAFEGTASCVDSTGNARSSWSWTSSPGATRQVLEP